MEGIDQRIIIGVVVGLVTLLGVIFSSSSSKKETVESTSSSVLNETSSSTKPTTTSASKKKKNKKKSAAAKKATSVEDAPKPKAKPKTVVKKEEPAPAPVVEAEASKKKKKKKKNKKAAAAAEPPKAKPKPEKEQPEPEDDDDDDEEDERDQAARLLGLQTNHKAPKKAPASPEFTKAQSKKNRKKSKTDNNNTESNGTTNAASEQPEIMLEIGDDPAIIIGPAGIIIQNIQATSGAKLDVLKNTPGPGQNMVRITASSEANIAQAMELVQAILDEQEKQKANMKTVSLGPKDINGSDGVKAIIGRGGETIKDIEGRCEGQVKLDCNVQEGTVVVKGTKEMVDKAVKMCKNAVFGEAQDTIQLKGRSQVNIVFGKEYTTIRQLQTATGAKLDIDKETNVLKFSGKLEQVAAAKQAVTLLLQRCGGITMDIKAGDIGAVYGKAGSSIRNIQDRTGAYVEVSQQPGADSAKCTVSGEPAAVEEARVMILRAVAREVELKPGEIAETMSLGGATPAVIGRGGARVKELEKTHSVQLNVNSETGICRIVGKEKAVKSVREVIDTIVAPILLAEEAKKQADLAAEAGDSAWQGHTVPADEDGW